MVRNNKTGDPSTHAIGRKRWQASGHHPIPPLRNLSSNRPTTMRGTGRFPAAGSCNRRLAAGGLALAGFGTRAAQAQQAGGHLRIGRAQDSDTLDPHKTFLLVSHEIMWQIYDSLIYLDASGNVYPGAAESWAFSNDNLTVTFKLRPGPELPRRHAAQRRGGEVHGGPACRAGDGLAQRVPAGAARPGGGDRRSHRRLPLHGALRAAMGGPQLLLLRAHQPDGGQEARRSLRPQSGRHRPVQVRELAARSGHSPGAQRGARLGDALVRQPGQGPTSTASSTW